MKQIKLDLIKGCARLDKELTFVILFKLILFKFLMNLFNILAQSGPWAAN